MRKRGSKLFIEHFIINGGLQTIQHDELGVIFIGGVSLNFKKNCFGKFFFILHKSSIVVS